MWSLARGLKLILIDSDFTETKLRYSLSYWTSGRLIQDVVKQGGLTVIPVVCSPLFYCHTVSSGPLTILNNSINY